MRLIPSFKINQLFTEYRDHEIEFNKEVVKASGLIPEETYLKCGGEQWRCVFSSASFVSGKVAVNIGKERHEKIIAAKDIVSIHCVFYDEDERSDTISLFLSGKITHMENYKDQDSDLKHLTVAFTNRPSNDYITIMGLIVEAQVTALQNEDVMVPLNAEVVKFLDLNQKASSIRIDHLPRPCVLRDVSFKGANIVMSGLAKFLVKKNVDLVLRENSKDESYVLSGIISNSAGFKGRKDLNVLTVDFAKESVSLNFKIWLTRYFKNPKK